MHAPNKEHFSVLIVSIPIVNRHCWMISGKPGKYITSFSPNLYEAGIKRILMQSLSMQRKCLSLERAEEEKGWVLDWGLWDYRLGSAGCREAIASHWLRDWWAQRAPFVVSSKTQEMVVEDKRNWEQESKEKQPLLKKLLAGWMEKWLYRKQRWNIYGANLSEWMDEWTEKSHRAWFYRIHYP